MQDDKARMQNITLEVDGIRHRLSVLHSKEPLYRDAAAELNRAVSIYRNRHPDRSEVPQAGYLSMAAIDTAYRAVVMRHKLEARAWADRLASLSDEIEALLLYPPTEGQPPLSSPSAL